MRETINVQLAPGWRTITPEELPPNILNIGGEAVKYVAAAVPSTPSYAPNLVAVRTTLAPDDNPEEILIASATVMADSIPGMRMLDELAIAGPPQGRRLRSATYILDDISLTILQIAWLDRSDEGTHLWTATFTCATREFSALSEQLIHMSNTLEVAA